ncbi:FAD-dependent oxidoreductase [Streptomyces winkii]|uniref:FAD-dependent oxidoreductase n=1 Tax=Streptomyces winkii TaxID=3051178 RepID=UPI0028D13681|nr:FAD-dependent oxidoreductase [Streptomyces sp. DSM 40971]
MARSGTHGTASTGAGVSHASYSTDVIVVGAGPTGLMTAGDLAEAGHGVTLVERRDETISNLTRALVVHARTLEQLDARGLAEELIGTGARMESLGLFRRAVLHPSTLPSRFPYVLVTGQFEVERLLERRARKAGVTFRYGTEVLELRQDGSGVEVDVTAAQRPGQPDGGGADGGGAEGSSGATSGEISTLRASYLVGTDGVRSTIRDLLGLPFPGKSVIRSIVLADVRLSDPPAAPFQVNAQDDAFALVASFGDGWYRVMGWNRHRQLPDSRPAGLEEVREFTVQALGSDFGMHDPRWISRFHSDERQAPRYRVGRVFLAGDAAHVHSPAGGMGMNTGLQDAANLTWKLSAVLRGRSPASLLETYESERHRVGKLVLRMSGTIIRLALARSTAGRALRAVITEVVNRVRPLGRRAIRMVSGVGISYPAPRGSHPLTGKRAPDLPLASGRLYEALREGAFVLVSPVGTPAPDTGEEADDRTVHARSDAVGSRTLLIRPDGYIAWASDGPDPQGLRQALAEWTGSPAVRAPAAA